MEFRAPAIAAQQNADAVAYLTKNLSDPKAGQRLLTSLADDLGNATNSYPDWHPLLTAPQLIVSDHVSSLSQLRIYDGIDHTVEFVKGFITCPYSDATADTIVDAVNKVSGLSARRLAEPLYSDSTYPVVVSACDVVLEADGTIRSRDALAWFAQQTAKEAGSAQVGETWWNIRSYALGRPHGSRSSLFVNQHTGSHMRKILEAMNNSGMFGPIKEESSLDMLSRKKRDKIGDTLIRTAVTNWDKKCASYRFELRGEICNASLRDTWNDNTEISVRVEIGKYLHVSGFYYANDDKITSLEPRGKRELAEKFL